MCTDTSLEARLSEGEENSPEIPRKTLTLLSMCALQRQVLGDYPALVGVLELWRFPTSLGR